MRLSSEFICNEIANQSYEISLHADDERIADGLTITQLELALSTDCTILEQYLEGPRGESCLSLGFTSQGIPVHVVCGRNRSGHLILITVYIPRMPKWKDPYTRNR
jgi:hypothetical protein